MCTALERLAEENRQRGIEQGIERGIAQGRCEERDATVKALLLQGLLPEQKIAEAVNISMKQLQEIKEKMIGGKVCDYLVNVTTTEAAACNGGPVWTRPIWDVTGVAWLLDGDFEEDCLIHSPIPEYDNRYAFDNNRHFIKYVYHIKRDKLFADLFAKLSR